MLNCIDLFAGAGGLSSGFSRLGFNILLANEVNSEIAKTYQYNHKKTLVLVEDIRKITLDSIKSKLEGKSVHVITGGPPCQGFSMSGYRIRKNVFMDDPRNMLFKEYYRIVAGINPDYFVIENVEGLLTMQSGIIKDTIIELFEDLGYHVTVGVTNAGEYGVPQSRRRVVFLGSKKSKLDFPRITHSPDNNLKPFVTIKDAISDLSFLESGEGEPIVKYNYAPETEYQRARRQDSHLLFNHVATKHSKLAIERMKLVPPGGNREQLPKEHKTKSVHSGAYGRMEWDKPATTITTRFDTPSTGRVIHPCLNRTITVREAARLQSFDDNYKFLGSRSSQGIQVGNAVPPLLAEAFAKVILEDASKLQLTKSPAYVS
jgi:DNA (cytosine-5)-methyltransferase 1